MAKTKNKKKFADKIQKKKESQFKPKSINPFEVHLNKEKLKVIGRKLKNEKGLPGVSRAKAINKRKHTLLQEYKIQNKSNKFTDKRIGERNQGISDVDKAMMRFAASRIKAHKRKNIFNLAEDEIITHKGLSLQEIEKFDDPRSEDEEEDDREGRLNSKFVKEAHFGGGMFNDTGKDGATSHKQLIDQLIEESKKRKAEQQRIKEATLELTEKLDTEWKDLMQIVNKTNKEDKAVEVPAEKSSVDDYDKMLKELRFEKRGTVSDRLKTETELEEQTKEKLEKLQQERLERMQADFVDSIQMPHRSADDLDDDIVYEEDADYTLSYNEQGKSNLKIDAQINGHMIGEDSTNNDNSEEASEQDQSDANESSDDNESNESDAESDDSLADLKEDEVCSDSEMDDDEQNKDEITLDTSPKKKETSKAAKSNVDISSKECQKHENKRKNDKIAGVQFQKTVENLKKVSAEVESLASNLPLPESYDSLMETLQGRTPLEQSVLLKGIIKCNDPSVSQGNKEQLGLLFAYLLQYLNDLFSEVADAETMKTNFQIFRFVMPSLYDLAKISTINAHNSLLEVIKEKYSDYRNKKSSYPGIELLVFLKLISLLFTTSDFRHQVVTPSFVFMEQMLTKCKVKTGSDIVYGLFVCTLYLEYTTLSNRYLPSVINFLSGLLHMAIPKTSVRLIKAPHPFKSLNNQLVLTEDCSKLKIKPKMNGDGLVLDSIDDELRISTLYVTMKILNEFTEKYKNLSSNVEIFSLVKSYLCQIPIKLYPKEVRKEHLKLKESLETMQLERKLFYVVMEQKKPKALRLYEPKFEAIYDTKRHKSKSKEKAEQDKLLYKFKKEKKGALREIRRDKAFLGRIKIKQRIQSDIERRDKVNRIFAEAASQQSELNSLDRQKKKKK